MAEINRLRDEFLRELDSLFEQAAAVEAALSMGYAYAEDHIGKFGDVGYSFGVGHPSKPERVLSKALSVKDIPEICRRRPGITRELFHGRIIRAWYDFIKEVYGYQLSEYFAGRLSFVPTAGLKVKVKLDRREEISPQTAIVHSLKTAFSFLASEKQCSTIIKALGAKLDDQQIRKHTIARNSLEHHGGIVRDDDIRELGAQSIILLDNAGRPTTFKVGDRLAISIWDIESVVDVFDKASRTLVP